MLTKKIFLERNKVMLQAFESQKKKIDVMIQKEKKVLFL